MTDAYRQKLLNWFCSASLVLTFFSLNLLVAWFYGVPRLLENYSPPTFVDFAIHFNGAILFYALMFPIILFWHFWDFVQSKAWPTGWLNRLSSYSLFLIALVPLNALSLLAASGLLTTTSCDAVKGALHFECYLISPVWLDVSSIANLLLALCLCLAKAVISISSNLTKVA